MAKRARVAFMDWARLVALGLMVFGHVQDAVLDDAVRATAAYAAYDHLRGYTAPLFLVLSGMAFLVSTEAAFEEFLRPSWKLLRRLLRGLGLLAIGYALSAPHDELGELLAMTRAEEEVFWRCNVLQCIGASLILAHLLVLVLRDRARVARAAAVLAAALVIVTPAVAAAGFHLALPLPLAQALGPERGSFFPLLPWAAYFFAGIALGSLLVSGAVRERVFLRGAGEWGALVAVCSLAVATWRGWDSNAAVYQPPGLVIFAGRLAGALAVAGLVGLAVRSGRTPLPVAMVTRSSLTVYVAHLLLAWGSPWNKGLAQVFPREFALGGTVAAAAAVFVLAASAGIATEAAARAPRLIRERALALFSFHRPSAVPDEGNSRG